MKKFLLATAVAFAVPAAANAQSDWFSSTYKAYPGFYIGAQGGLNWLLNNQSYVMPFKTPTRSNPALQCGHTGPLGQTNFST